MTPTGSNGGIEQGLQTVSLSYNETDDLAQKVMGLLEKSNAPLGYGIVSLMLVIARLSNDDIDQLGEIKFVEAFSDYLGAYWGEQNGNN